MTAGDFLGRLVVALDRAQIPYMVTGSLASSAHGRVRATEDIDFVIAPTEEQLRALVAEFPRNRYYVDENARRRSGIEGTRECYTAVRQLSGVVSP